MKKDSDKELWKPIKEYELLYEISNTGKVSVWRKKKGSDYSPRERKRVAQYTLEDKFVRKFRSINEAGRETNSSIGTIQKCCVGKSHTCNGYKWKYVLDKGE